MNNNDDLGLGLGQNKVVEPRTKGSNAVATCLKILGIIEIVAGVIISIAISNPVYILVGFISGIAFIGFGEIIRLLQLLVDK